MESYAWNLLKQKFENKRLIVQYLVQLILTYQLLHESTLQESHTDLRILVNNVATYTNFGKIKSTSA